MKSINVEGGIFQKNLLHKCNKREVEGGKILEINKRAGWIFVLCRVEFSKIGKRDVTFIREMRVHRGVLKVFMPLVWN